MNRLRAYVVGDLDDLLQLQIGLGRRRAADVMRFVGVAHVDGAAIRV